jgi:hypothetical protein
VVACTASDAEAGLAVPADAAFQLLANVAPGTSNAAAFTASHEVCDAAGNCAKVGPIGPLRVDRQPPVVSCRAARGWIRGTAAAIRCHAHDSGSGLVGPAYFSLAARIGRGTEGVAETATRRVCDRSGNCATVGPLTVALDDKPPSVSCSSVPRGWLHAAVRVACTVTDYGSGVRRTAQLLILRANVRAGVLSRSVRLPRRTVCDRVGNCTRTPRLPLAKIDRRRR